MPTSHEAFVEETRALSLLIQAGDERHPTRRETPRPPRTGIARVRDRLVACLAWHPAPPRRAATSAK